MEAPIAEIKPNIKKAFIANLLFVFSIVALVISTLIYLNAVVGLNVFIESFKEIGIIISPSSLLFWFIVLILFFTALLLILNYISLGKISYTIYPDKINYSRSFLIMQISDKTIPYANIAKVFYENKSFLKTSKVVLELTGMKESKVEIDYIDDAQELIRKIQELVSNYRANYYAKYSQDYRYQNIMDRFK